MKKGNRYKATVILGIAALGFMASHPFDHTFWGGLLSSGFSAAMIGGIADWFGVTALTRRPLGIPFRTEIIPRSKRKLFDSLVHMVEGELLTKETLKRKLEETDISDKLINYLEVYGGKQDIQAIISGVVSDILSKADPQEIGGYLDRLAQETLPGIKVAPLLVEALEWTTKNGYDEKALDFIIDELTVLVKNKQVNNLIAEVTEGILQKLKSSTEKERTGKRLVYGLMFNLMSFTNMSSSNIAAKLNSELLAFLINLKHPESGSRHNLIKWIADKQDKLKNNPETREKVEKTAAALIGKADLTPIIMKYFHDFRGSSDTEPSPKLQSLIESLINKVTLSFKENKRQQKDVDEYVKGFLLQLIEDKHGEIGKLVRQKLNEFSDDSLVQLIEDKAGDDLQIIRINGSVVGGLAGMVIFVMTYWIFRGW